MAELDLSFLSFLALAFAVGFVAGFMLRGLGRRRIEDMLQFFRQRDQEQDRRIANLERDLSDARGRLLSIKADQGKGDPGKGDPGKGDPGKGDPGKGDRASGELRAAYDEAQRTIARLREELARPLPAAEPAAAEPAAAIAEPEPEKPPAPAQPAAPPSRTSPAPKAASRNGGKKGRLP